jgi:hypothetical protein
VAVSLLDNIMAYIITGTFTFSSQANRDAARTRLDAALLAYSYTPLATAFTAGITNPTTTTMTVSILDGNDGNTAAAMSKSIYDALVVSNRHTAGFLSVNKI